MDTEFETRREIVETEGGTAKFAEVVRRTLSLVAKQVDIEALDAALNALYEQLNEAEIVYTFSYSSEKKGDEIYYRFNGIQEDIAPLFADILSKFSLPQEKAEGQTLKEAWYAAQDAATPTSDAAEG